MHTDIIQLTADLTIKGKPYAIAGGDIKTCSVQLEPWGFTGEMTFMQVNDVHKDPIIEAFSGLDRIDVTLQVSAVFPPQKNPKPIKFTGVVLLRTVRESVFANVKDLHIMEREYTITFADPMQSLWSQHFPVQIETETSVSKVIKAQIVTGITLKMTWDKLDKDMEMACLNLDVFLRVSFYDFVLWWLNKEMGVLSYDYDKQSYEITDKKLKQKTTYQVLPAHADVECVYAQIPRFDSRLLNTTADTPKDLPIKQEQSVAGLHQDCYLRSDVESDITARKTLEENRLSLPEVRQRLNFKVYPLVAVTPGTPVKFDATLWGATRIGIAAEYTVRSLSLQFTALQQAADNNRGTAFAGYTLDMMALLTQAEPNIIPLPAFTPPVYPLLVEGFIVSPPGKETDKTYEFKHTDKDTEDTYLIDVPLFDKKIKAPFQPNTVPGHWFFPLYKKSKVLLQVYFNRTDILQTLDWGDRVRLPGDSQGNHLLLGKGDDNETSFKHVYTDEKPVLSITRTCNKDTELIQLEDEVIILQTKQDE